MKRISFIILKIEQKLFNCHLGYILKIIVEKLVQQMNQLINKEDFDH